MLHRIVGKNKTTLDAVAEGIEFGHALAALSCRLPGARGLVEDRSRASVMDMAADLRRRRNVEPSGRDPSLVGSNDAGRCDWCLLDLRSQRPNRRATAG